MYDASYKLTQAKPCSADALQNLNETKEYRLIATCTLRQVLRDPELSDAAVRVWLTLYELGARNEGMKMIVSVRRVAEILERSESSIRRAVRQLQDLGYVDIGTRRDPVHGQGANSLAPRLPATTAEKLMKDVPARITYPRSVPDSTGPGLSKQAESQPSDVETTETPVSNIDEKPPESNSQPLSLKSRARVAGRQDTGRKTPEMLLAEIEEWDRQTKLKEHLEQAKPAVKNERGGAVKSDTHYSTSQRDKTNSYGGPVRFPKFLEQRTRARLIEMGFAGAQLSELVSQVRFSLERGVFQEHSPSHGVNVALKLIRQNTWRAPIGWAMS